MALYRRPGRRGRCQCVCVRRMRRRLQVMARRQPGLRYVPEQNLARVRVERNPAQVGVLYLIGVRTRCLLGREPALGAVLSVRLAAT